MMGSKRTWFLIAALVAVHCSSSQVYDPFIDTLMNRLNTDTLVSYVRILSGEDSVVIGGEKVLIEQRVFNTNDLAAEYLIQTLSQFGLEVHDQTYSPSGRNVYAIQTGTLFPEKQFIICAHL